MKGLELAQKYFEAYGRSIIDSFPEIADKITFGLVGEGSECFGFDDELSQDHDFEPCFCMFLDKEYEEAYGFKLERAYAKLPKEFLGYTRQRMSPCGGNRHGLILTEDFYQKHLGTDNAPDTLLDFFRIPSFALSEVTNGAVFKDGDNKFSKIRLLLQQGYPEDVRLKKISAHLALMHQSGVYNYPRCLSHGETGSAQLALFRFVESSLQVIYMLNHAYCPYYKWAFRGLRNLPILSELEQPLTFLIENGNTSSEANYKQEIMQDISVMVTDQLKEQNITKATCANLDTHAYSVLDQIKDIRLRNLHIMETGEKD